MAKICQRCGKRVGFLGTLTKDGICVPCDLEVRKTQETVKLKTSSQIAAVIDHIAATKTVNEAQNTYLESLDLPQRDSAYIALVNRFLGDGELDAQEAQILAELHSRLSLNPNTSSFIDRVVPSLYVASIRIDSGLPAVPEEIVRGMDVILKRGEITHYFCKSVLKEIRVRTGFVAGSQGVSIRVMKGVSYRVGGSRGHVTREEQLTETSRGTLLITNTRLLLHPEENTKPVSIPLTKILSYKCYDDGVVLYKDGREKPFVFAASHPGEAETIGICLGFLCADL